MVVISYPSTLPAVARLENYTETLPDNVLISEMEVGPVQTRKRSGSCFAPIDMTFSVDTEIKDRFVSFYREDCSFGVAEFQKTAFDGSGDTHRYLFRTPPSMTAIAPGKWRVSLALWKTAEL